MIGDSPSWTAIYADKCLLQCCQYIEGYYLIVLRKINANNTKACCRIQVRSTCFYCCIVSGMVLPLEWE